MRHFTRREHPMDSLFSFLLFGIFVLLLLLMILFSAQAYQASMDGLEENSNLRTSMAYLTTKVRQHDEPDALWIGTLEDMDALCFKDVLSGKEYITYIYLDGMELKELFTAASTVPSPSMGTVIVELKAFLPRETADGFWDIYIEDTKGNDGSLLLHPQGPTNTAS
ncbi:MAG: DUF4860 domain-containing protein [Blautia sp.]|jgi:hypothetical protein